MQRLQARKIDPNASNDHQHDLLGIECGGTRTVALLVDSSGGLRRRVEAGPANLRLVSDAELLSVFRTVRKQAARPDAIGLGMAGIRTAEDRQRIAGLLAQVWPAVPCQIGNDLESAFAAGGPVAARFAARVAVVSGTGSCCYGKNAKGTMARVGGWGHILGDRGSAYDAGVRALRQVIAQFDRTAQWPNLGARLLRALQLNRAEDLIGWAQSAAKADLAALAVEVVAAAKQGDALARRVMAATIEVLADDAVACADRLAPRGARVDFVLSGGLIQRDERVIRHLSQAIARSRPRSAVRVLDREPAWGAVEMARWAIRSRRQRSPDVADESKPPPPPDLPVPELAAIRESPTERRNPKSANFDRLPLEDAIELMLGEDARIPGVLRTHKAAIARGVRLIVRGLRRGGRLLYVGAGTSGRLGVLDASECPPTFRTEPDQVQGIMAGGDRALWSSIEGAEDDAPAGAEAILARAVSRRDVVVGIAASGRTPFVWGALEAAKRLGATTILLCFNPTLRIDRRRRPDLVIAPDLGPEVLTGSTRLKCGTATKLVLNLFTTLAMVRLGKVVSNLMVDLNPSNVKLRDRAIRIVSELAGVGATEARAALEGSGWVIKRALKRLDGSRKRPS